jgi:hypothetical protein
VPGPRGILNRAAQGAVQLFLDSWSLGPFGPISISDAGHLFTKQLLCQLSYAGVLEKGNGSLLGPGRRGLPLVRDKELLPARARRAGKPLLSLSCR